MRIAVLASGSGTILDAICAAGVPVAVAVVDRECGAQAVAERNGIECELMQRRSYARDFDRDGYTAEVAGLLTGYDIDLVAMAGFGTILGERAYPSIADIPGPVDLAYLLLATEHVEGVIADVAAKGIVEYQNMRVENPFKDDTWLRAISIKPGDRSVLHHVVSNHVACSNVHG
jgi:hypothetical protein